MACRHCAFHPNILTYDQSTSLQGPCLQVAFAGMRRRMLAGGTTEPDDLLRGVVGEMEGVIKSMETVIANKIPPSEWAAHGLPPALQQRICPNAASNSDTSQGATSCHQATEPVSHAEPDLEQPAGEQYGTSPTMGSCVGTKRGRRAARKVWACACCGKVKALEGGKLRECTGCRSVRYCGRECQLKHWPVHKAPCKGLHAAGE